MSARVERSNGRIAISGALDFDSAAAVLGDSRSAFEPDADLTVDLGAVQRTDSAGVALLLEWLRLARRNDCRVRFSGMPAQMRNIIDFCELSDVIGPAADTQES